MSLDIGYPLYSATLVSADRALVTGGGGEGNNGIPNKISLVAIRAGEGKGKASVEVLKEYEIPGRNDSPTSVLYTGGNVFLSCNTSTEDIKAGNNKHLRKYALDLDVVDDDKEKKTKDFIKSVTSVDVAHFTDPQDYIKTTKLSTDGKTLALVSSSVPSVIRLVDVNTLKVTKTIELKDKEEVLDIAFGEGKFAYILQHKLVILFEDEDDKEEEEKTLEYGYFSPSYQLAKLEYTETGSFLVGVNLKNKKGILLMEAAVVANEGEDFIEAIKTKLRIRVRKARVLTNKPAKITSLTIQGELIALSTNLNSIIISDLTSFKNHKTLEKVHSFAITSVKITSDLKQVISVSVSGTISIYTIPDDLKVDYWEYLPFLIVLIVGILFYKVNVYVQREYKDQINKFCQVMFGEDFIPDQVDVEESFGTVLSVETGYTVKEGDIVEEVVKSKSNVEVEVETEIDEEIVGTGTMLI